MRRGLALLLSGVALVSSACESSRTAGEKSHCVACLKAIGRGAEEFREVHQVPCWETPVVGKAGLSWRVELLPYIEHNQLHKAIKDETANFTINPFEHDNAPKPNKVKDRPLLHSRVYHYTIDNPPGTAPYRRVVKPDRPDAFVVVETSDFVRWAPAGDDLVIKDGEPLPKMGGNFKGGFFALCADGMVRWPESSMSDKAIVDALFDGEGGEVR